MISENSAYVDRWLRRYSQTFPMYGKRLEDFPDRHRAFLAALEGLNPEDIQAGFRECSRHCQKFPVPSEVRAAAEAHRRIRLMNKEQADRDSALKAERFVQGADVDAERDGLRAEFWEMLKEAGLRRERGRTSVSVGVPTVS